MRMSSSERRVFAGILSDDGRLCRCPVEAVVVAALDVVVVITVVIVLPGTVVALP